PPGRRLVFFGTLSRLVPRSPVPTPFPALAGRVATLARRRWLRVTHQRTGAFSLPHQMLGLAPAHRPPPPPAGPSRSPVRLAPALVSSGRTARFLQASPRGGCRRQQPVLRGPKKRPGRVGFVISRRLSFRGGRP